jgi:hypothetical protein
MNDAIEEFKLKALAILEMYGPEALRMFLEESLPPEDLGPEAAAEQVNKDTAAS